MAHLTIKLNQAPTSAPCALCGNRITPADGPRLYLADGPEVVCRECGKKHAPSLVALLDLAQVAERVGRIGRHTLVPPMTVMIDLVQAAEDYTRFRPARARKAA